MQSFAETTRALFCIAVMGRWVLYHTRPFGIQDYVKTHGYRDCGLSPPIMRSFNTFLRWAVAASTLGVLGPDRATFKQLATLPQRKEHKLLQMHLPDITLSGFLLAFMEACEGQIGLGTYAFLDYQGERGNLDLNIDQIIGWLLSIGWRESSLYSAPTASQHHRMFVLLGLASDTLHRLQCLS